MQFKRTIFLSTLFFSAATFSADDAEKLRKEFNELRENYEQRIDALENKQVADQPLNNFNPQISFILDGQYSAHDNNPEDYELPGFALGGEAGLSAEGFSLGHTEFSASANVDDKFYGKLTLAIANHEGETEVELEEAFFQTTALDYGFNLRAGRFFSSIGYINEQHAHAWDFADAPLVYRGLWGKKYIDDGLRVSWLAPTDFYLELGAEALAGGNFPAGGEGSSHIGAEVYFAKLGGDFDVSNSWQMNISHYSSEVTDRDSGGHDHGGDAAETPSFSGDSEVTGLSLIYKWAPQGNYKNRNFKLQAEFFTRDEDGDVVMEGSDPLEQTTLDGTQEGYYVQAIYQFIPQWRVGLRYDHLRSDNAGDDAGVLEEAGLDNEGIEPERKSIMLEWVPSEFSRIRVQYNHDESYEEADNQIFLQYTMSLGAHGAHAF